MSKKEQIIEKLKDNGCRITKQRLMLIDIILENECSSCRKNLYKVECRDDAEDGEGCEIVLDDHTICYLSPGNWNKVVREGMKRCGYLKDQKIEKIKVQN